MNKLRRYVWRIQMLLTICLVLFQSAKIQAGTEQLVHAIFVKVNGKTITQENVVEAVKYLVKREYNNITPQDEEELIKIQDAALRDLIRMHLIHDEADILGLRLDRPTQKRVMEISRLSLDEITPTIRKLLEADELFENLMMASGTPINSPSPREIKKFYNDNRDQFRTNAFIIVRSLFIGDDGSRSQEYFKNQAETIMAELQAIPLAMRTEAFANKAKEISQDVFASFGGLLTGNSADSWVPQEFRNSNPEGKPIFPEQMAASIRRLNRKGEIRLAVSDDGMHLLYCEDIKGGNYVSWDEASRIIEYLLKQRQKTQSITNWVNRIYDSSDIRWHDGAIYEKDMLTARLLPSERGPQI